MTQPVNSVSSSSSPLASSTDGKLGGLKKDYTVHIIQAPEKGRYERITAFAGEWMSRVSWTSLRGVWDGIWADDWSQMFLKAWKSGSFVSELPTIIGTIYLTADPRVMQAVQGHWRKSSKGLFWDEENTKLFIQGLFKDLFANEIQELGKEVANALVLTAETPHVARLRTPFVQGFGPDATKKMEESIRGVADGILLALSDNKRSDCDANSLAFEFAVAVVAKLFLGLQIEENGCQELGKTVDTFSRRMAKIVSRHPTTKEEDQSYFEAVKKMRGIIDQCITQCPKFVSDLRESGSSDFQIKVSLFGLFFAGTETTASALNYLIWQLGQDQELQKVIRDPINGQKKLKQVMAECFRLHPPVFIIGRTMRENVLLQVKDASKQVIFEKKIPKGHTLCLLPQAAGQNATLYPAPEKFKPDRFEDYEAMIGQLPFYPFGGGKHMCPGQHLATAELQIFATQLLDHYCVKTISPDKQQQKGMLLLRASPTHIALTSRN